MTKVLCNTKEICGDLSKFTVKYYLCTGKGNNSELFGICLEKYENNIIKDSETIYPLSEDKKMMENLVNEMAKCDATPVNLIFHLDDLMSLV